MARILPRSSDPFLPATFLLVLGLWACSDDAPTSGRSGVGTNLGIDQPTAQGVVFPVPPRVDFCGGTSVGTILDIVTDEAAGVTYSSNIVIPATGGRWNMYFLNDGPGSITFVPTGAFSVDGTQIPRSITTDIPMTPTGSTAAFWDRGHGGTFVAGDALLFCHQLDDIVFKSAKHRRATAHFDVSFTRAGVLHTIRVNVHASAFTD